jgi:methylmalonyl-CoA/ethylmalonyl-CoA epimerase
VGVSRSPPVDAVDFIPLTARIDHTQARRSHAAHGRRLADSAPVPQGNLAHICLLVSDLDEAVERWTQLLGVLDPEQVKEQPVRYEHFEGGGDVVRMAIFASEAGCEIQLLQPLNDGPSARLLASRGEGLHHIAFTPPDVAGAAGQLQDAGVRLTSETTMQDPGMPWMEFTFVAPDSANGALLELCTQYEAVDGRWEPRH